MWTGMLKNRKVNTAVKKKSESIARSMIERKEVPCVCANPESKEYISA